MKLKPFLALPLLLLVLARAAAAADTSFFYNGELEDGGSPANGEYNFIFTLFDHPTGGSPVGTPNITNGLPVSGGQFTARLDLTDGRNHHQRDVRIMPPPNGVCFAPPGRI